MKTCNKTQTNSVVAFLFLSEFFRKLFAGLPAPSTMSLIPAGIFQMGDSFDEGDYLSHETPVHMVYVSTFYIDKTETTKSRFDQIYSWAISHGYQFDNRGSEINGVNYSKGPTHPVHYVNWYDAIKWCNAKSEFEGRSPVYFTAYIQTNIYRTGHYFQPYLIVKKTDGYRLPTEAEWKKREEED